MYFYIKTVKRKTKIQSDEFLEKSYVSKGTKVFQIHNGTIGKGARYKNFTLDQLLKYLKSEGVL